MVSGRNWRFAEAKSSAVMLQGNNPNAKRTSAYPAYYAHERIEIYRTRSGGVSLLKSEIKPHSSRIAQGKGEEGTETAADENKKETADSVARHQADQ